MIEVRFLRKSGNLVAFTYNGHADFDDYGKDIVCAAVTAQCMMVYNGLDEVMKIKNRIDMDNEGGYLSVSIDSSSLKEKKDAQVLMETLLLGIKAIELQYGKFIKLIEEEV
ncbi:MAG: ribosomal-processing cysteine protease Prp [Clostridiaceae bacterium]